MWMNEQLSGSGDEVNKNTSLFTFIPWIFLSSFLFSRSRCINYRIREKDAESADRIRYAIQRVDMDNIENVAKEAMLTFFVETVEPYLVKFNFDTNTLNKINRWVSKITRLNVYSMKTHLLLLQQMIKKGELSPPFSNDPENTCLPQFDPSSPQTNPNLDRILQLFTKPKSSQFDKYSPESEMQDTTVSYTQSSDSADGSGANKSELPFTSRIPRRVNVNTSRHFTIPARRARSVQSRSTNPHISLLDRTYDIERPLNDRTYCVQQPLLDRTYDIERTQPSCVSERITHPCPRSVPIRNPIFQNPYSLQRTDRCVRSVCQERITNYESPATSTPCRRSTQLPDFSVSPITCPRTRSLPRRLSDTYVEEDGIPRVAPRSRFPVAQWRIRPTVQTPARPQPRNAMPENPLGQCLIRPRTQAPSQISSLENSAAQTSTTQNDLSSVATSQGSTTSTQPTSYSLPSCPRLRPRRLSFEDELRARDSSVDDESTGLTQCSRLRIPTRQWNSRSSLRIPQGPHCNESNSSSLGIGSGLVNECCP